MSSAHPDPVKVPLDPLTADFERMVRTQLAQLARQVNLRVPVDAAGERLRAQVAAQIRAVESTLRAEIPVDPEQAAQFRRKLAAQVAAAERTVRANISVDVDRGVFERLSSAFGRLFDFTHLGAQATATFGQMAGSATEMGGAVTKAALSGTGALGGLVGSASTGAGALASLVAAGAGAVVQLAAMAAIASLVAAALGLVAGAILAVGGAVTAGLAGLPVLLTGLLGPIAAVALGFEGIKRAAEPLRDEFEALRTAVADTFERTMAPVFERLVPLFPILQAGLTGIAASTAMFASGLVDVITSEAGLRNIEAALAGVGVFLNAALPGAQALLGALLNVAATQPLYQILGETIGGLSERLAGFLTHVTTTGLLTAALTQLRDVLFSASGALGALTEGAMVFFTEAGPGLAAFFDGLQAAFGNIDFAALGDSFGRIFAAIGDGLARVPPETWQNLANAVADFAGSVQSIVDSGALNSLINLFAMAVTGAGNLLQSITAAGYGIQGMLNLMQGDLDGAAVSFTRAWTAMQSTTEIHGKAIADSGNRNSRAAADLIKQNLATLPPETARIANQSLHGFAGGLAPMPGQGGAIAGDTANRIGGGLRQGEPQARSAGGAMSAGLAAAIRAGQSTAVGAAVQIALAAWRAARAALGIGSPSRLFMGLGDQVVAGFVLGIQHQTGAVQAAMTALARTAATRFDATLTAGLGTTPGAVTRSLAALDRAHTGGGRLLATVGPSGRTNMVDTVGSASSAAPGAVTPAALTAAMVAALDQSELRFGGDNMAKIVNRTNLDNARR